ncbi:hypothetical protein PC128_g19224 [Phytophthora cactorum]|nr:hypothetical protein PC128_g19224 [Phytophthora cactorum]
MGRGPPLTDIERGRILGLHEAGFGLRKIARKVERSVGAVQRVIYAPPTKCKKPGPATSLSDRELCLLVQTASKGQLSAKLLKLELQLSAKLLKLELQLSTSVRTIQRVLAGVH